MENGHLVVPNPCTLLITLSGVLHWFTGFLKEVFLCVPRSPESQELLTFEWEDLNMRLSSSNAELYSPKDLRMSFFW